MKIILLERVKKVGDRYEVVEVANGYAQNFLLPRGLAQPATETNLKRLESARSQWAEQKEERIRRFEKMVGRLEDTELSLEKQANVDGVLFGSVSKEDVLKNLREEGYEVNNMEVVLSEPIKEVGERTVLLKLPYENEVEIKVTVKPAAR